MYSVNFREEIRVELFDEEGALRDEALAKFDHGLRCKRTKEVRAIDPRLAIIVSIVFDHFGKKRMDLVSGFRFQRNEGSRHFHGAAVDLTIPGVPVWKLHKFVETLDTGNMGIGLYPRSGFVHIDIRAPEDPSYRWIDRSRPGRGGNRGKRPNRVLRKK